MKKGKNDETLAKASKKNGNEVCLTEEELESASGGYKIMETFHSEVTEATNYVPKEWTDYTVEGRTLGIGPKKSKTFATKKEAEKWASKNLFF